MARSHGKRRARERGEAPIAQARQAVASATAAAPPARPAPWRDPWAWASALAVLPLVWHSRGAPLGEPVAEDFDFLHRALLTSDRSLLDGGGSMAFWRPVAHQLYYLAFGPLMLTHPRELAAVHALLMALASVLVYLALRRSWSGPAAAIAASFPLFAESTRTLLSWPSHFVDLGLWLFTALALFEASRGRLWTTLAALALALGCKELAVVAAFMVPWMPGNRPRAARVRWATATTALIVAWGVAYVLIRRQAHLELPHNLEHDTSVLATPLPRRVAWAVWNSLRAVFSLPLMPTSGDGALALVLEVVALIAAIGLVARRGAFGRLIGRGGAGAGGGRGAWTLWGLAWFALACGALVAIYPIWQPNRSAFGSMGLGIGLAALLEAAYPWLPAALFTIRLGMFSISPGPPVTVTAKAPQTGAFMDFDHLVRLQRLMEGIRTRLARSYPTLPHGVRVCQTNMPRLAEYAFGKSFALQCWYRDTTVHWMRYEDFRRDTSLHPITVVQYEPEHEPMIELVEPQAMRLVEDTSPLILREDWKGALALLERADTLQKNRGAGNFFSILGTRLAICYTALGRHQEAEAAARMALANWRGSPNARYWIAMSLTNQKRYAEASAVIDTALFIAPNDTTVRELRDYVRGELIQQGR